jgi:6,7-dimethyl-8-ribityllumazine synthase
MADINDSNLFETAAGVIGKRACIVIVRTEWNAAVIDKLEESCKNTLTANNSGNIKTLTVPGAFEIPFAIKSYWEASKYLDCRPSAFIALGCVLRGDTPHFDYVCKGVTDGIMQLNLHLPIPIIFGILTVDNQQQADDRSGGKHGNKGEEAAVTAIKMIALQHSFKTMPRKS